MPGFEVLYGRNAVLESLRANRRRFYRLLLAQNLAAADAVNEIAAAAHSRNVPRVAVERAQLDKIVGKNQGHHQGVALEASGYPYISWQESLAACSQSKEMPLFLMLDCLQDPQNVGSLLRTAEGVGVHGVILPKRRAVDITPAVVNASAGAVEHLRVDIVSNLAQTLEQMKAANLWAVGLEDTPAASGYAQAALDMPLVLVVGSEGSGISRLLRERCDFLIRLPMRGRIGSLNAAAAGSVALYEIDRQRRAAEPASIG